MTLDDQTILFVLAAVNGFAVLVLLLSAVMRRPTRVVVNATSPARPSETSAADPESSAPLPDALRDLIEETEGGDGTGASPLHGEERLARDLARWRGRGSRGRVLPGAAGACRVARSSPPGEWTA